MRIASYLCSNDWEGDRIGEQRLLSRREVSARQDAMTYLVRVRGLLVDGGS